MDNYVCADYRATVAQARPFTTDDQPDCRAMAWRILGASYCNLGDLAGATNAGSHLGPMDREYVMYVCHRNGIVLNLR